MNSRPAGIAAKSCGTQMNVSPVFPAPTISAEASGRIENTVQSTMIPASSETELLPNPSTNAFTVVSSRARM